MQILKRTTSPKNLHAYLFKMDEVAKKLGVTFTWVVTDCKNYLFHYDMHLSLIVEAKEGLEENVTIFDKLID